MSEQTDQTTEFDFENHRLQAIQAYQKIRPLYEEYTIALKNVLSEAFKARNIKIHSIEARAKAIVNFGNKAITPSPDDPNKPYYQDPMNEITDMAGVRIIVFLPRTLEIIDSVIQDQFHVIEKTDKTQILIQEEKFGYASIHYLAEFRENRTNLLEYKKFLGLIAEIQARTILQHAWAEIEHDIQYKAAENIPSTIRRKFMSLSGMLEIADREFQSIQDDDERLRTEARKSVEEGKLEQVEITSDALKTYLDKKLGYDRRYRDISYEWTVRLLRNFGFSNFEQIDECIRGFSDDELSRIAWGTRAGQISRFEFLLLAGMGENYLKLHLWKNNTWFINIRKQNLTKFKAAGISIRSYIPPSKREQ